MKEKYKFVISLLICLLASMIGGLFTADAVSDWYPTLNKPSFNPPDVVFGPVWITLYMLMGIALYLVWAKGTKKVVFPLIIFGLQLFLNVLWSALFFGFKMIFYAFIEIIALWVMILFTMILFYKYSKVAFWLLFPYILWVSFAAVLNYMIFVLNV